MTLTGAGLLLKSFERDVELRAKVLAAVTPACGPLLHTVGSHTLEHPDAIHNTTATTLLRACDKILRKTMFSLRRRYMSTLLSTAPEYSRTPTDVRQPFFSSRRDGEGGERPLTYLHPRHGTWGGIITVARRRACRHTRPPRASARCNPAVCW